MMEDDIFGEVIYSYSRREAIADGNLVDVSAMAKEAGFKIPVAVTASVWHQYIEWTDEDSENQTSQDQEGRFWDVLYMLYVAVKSYAASTNCIFYKLLIVPRDGKTEIPRMIELKSVIGGGDNGEPVITIMLPNED